MDDLTSKRDALTAQIAELSEQLDEIKLQIAQKGKPALDLPIPPNDAAAKTVREYLSILLSTVWEEEAGFDGKRPFGNSGWKYDLIQPVIDAGLVETEEEADRVIAEAIVQMCGGDGNG